MLIKGDGKSIEWRAAVDLAHDPVGAKEIFSGLDMHTDNQRIFGLPERRLAKIFLYRLIYGGDARGYAVHPDFSEVSNKVSFWEDVIEKAYKKYAGLKKWQDETYRHVIEHGWTEIPTGRRYQFQKESWGAWPRTKIINYPVQGFAAELCMIARRLLKKNLDKLEIYQNKKALLINTVHDDIEMDVDNSPQIVYNICIEMEKAFNHVAAYIKKVFDYQITVPIECEVKVGISLNEKEMFIFNKETFEKDYANYRSQCVCS